MNATDRIMQGIINAIQERGIDFEIANSYGEPGYDSDKPILLANLNQFDKSELNAIERHYEINYDDEWTVLYEEDCKAYRTNPDCYGWQPSIVIWNCEYVSIPYLVESGNLKEYVESELTDNPLAALNSYAVKDCHLEEFATCIQYDLENGFHPGMNDNPKEILKLYPDRRENMFFRIDSVSQFYLTFQLWEMKGESY